MNKSKNFIKKYRNITSFQNLFVVISAIWCILPLYILIRYIIIAVNTPIYYHAFEIMYVWYHPVFTSAFLNLGKTTILIFIVYTTYCLAINKNEKFEINNPCLILLIALIIWSSISTLLSGHVVDEWIGTSERLDGLRSYLIYAAVFLCSGQIKKKKMQEFVINGLSLSANAIAILIILQNRFYVLQRSLFSLNKSGIFFNTNHCAYYLTMTILCSIGLYLYTHHCKMRIIYGTSIALQFYALLKNNTFGCFLAVWITLPILYLILWKSGKKLNWEHLLPFAIIFILTLRCSDIAGDNFSVLFGDVRDIIEETEGADSAGSGRLALWKYAISKIVQKPILGYGPEGLSFDLPSYIHNDRPHNEYLQYAAFLGIPGLILYLSSLVTLAISCWKHLKKLNATTLIAGGAMIGYLISAFFGNTMFYTTPYFFMLFGMVAFALNADD